MDILCVDYCQSFFLLVKFVSVEAFNEFSLCSSCNVIVNAPGKCNVGIKGYTQENSGLFVKWGGVYYL